MCWENNSTGSRPRPAYGQALTLRRVIHPMATDNYRVVYDGREIGSIGIQVAANQREYWSWGLDTILPPPVGFVTRGEAVNKEAAMTAFRAMWDRFAADGERLAAFLAGMR